MGQNKNPIFYYNNNNNSNNNRCINNFKLKVKRKNFIILANIATDDCNKTENGAKSEPFFVEITIAFA